MNAFHGSFLLGEEGEDGGETNRQSPKPLLRSLTWAMEAAEHAVTARDFAR